MVGYNFRSGRFKRHEPQGLIKEHAYQLLISWPYAHDQWEEEENYREVINWELVQLKVSEGTSSLTPYQKEGAKKKETI